LVPPHRQYTFKLSSDSLFVERVVAIAGLPLHPPGYAVVLCVDENSQIQPLLWTQSLLAMGLGYVLRSSSHDDIRHGTTTLVAAVDVAIGAVIAECKPGGCHQEFHSLATHRPGNSRVSQRL
jgi:putative transposase